MTTYKNAIEATKVWAHRHGVVTSSTGFRAVDQKAYDALPEAVKHSVSHELHLGRKSSHGMRPGAKMRAWGELAGWLCSNKIILAVSPPPAHTLSRTRYRLADED